MNNSCLIIGKYDDSYAKLIEYGNLIHNNGFKINQVWQSDENYDEVGINFKENDCVNLMLIKDGEALYLEMIHEDDYCGIKLINLWNIIKDYEKSR